MKQIEQLIEKAKRLDERGLNDYREIKIEQGLIEKAENATCSIRSTASACV